MKFFFTTICLSAVVMLLAGPAQAHDTDRIRLSAWNIANFDGDVGDVARPGIGTLRDEEDFTALLRYRRLVGADIFALQEIAEPGSLKTIFPEDKFSVYFSGRFEQDMNNGREDGIYTAIVVNRNPDIKFIKQEDLDEIGIVTRDSDGNVHSTRWGTAILLEIHGKPVWVVSVHLKSSCSSTRKANTSKKKDCKIFWQQAEPLRKWALAKTIAGESFIIAGDFNRRFRSFDYEGVFWTRINNDNLEEPLMMNPPMGVDRFCPTRKGKSNEPIDWILVSRGLSKKVIDRSFYETRFSQKDAREIGSGLSDHCPIHIDMNF